MPTFDLDGGSEKIKKDYHIKMLDICNKNHMKVHLYIYLV